MSVTTIVDEATVRVALAEVPDPEIPVLSIVDLGLVERVDVSSAAIEVDLLPTFVGCPALDAIRDAVVARLSAFEQTVTVRFTYATAWTSDRITASGRERLRASGFAPPTVASTELLQLDAAVPCPFCGSRRTRLDGLFGPTQCRTIRYCPDCRQPFEAFKTV